MRSFNTPIVIYLNSDETFKMAPTPPTRRKHLLSTSPTWVSNHQTTRTLSWKLCKEGQGEYNLTWLPDPVWEWTLVPNNTSLERQELWTLIGRILAGIQIQAAVDYSRPWAIVRLLPNAQRYVVARFVNRQDADDHKRYLSRFLPAAEFEVIFDAPTDEASVST